VFRRDRPHFVAFDILSIDGEDLRAKPLLEP
jgi:ATP-dependent DNA ligase